MPPSPAVRRPPLREPRPDDGDRARRRVHGLVCGIALALALLAPLPEARADAGSRGEAIEEALAKNGGRGQVLGVREERTDSGVVYAVKVLTDGRVRVFRVRGR